jgi:hypothetical protein
MECSGDGVCLLTCVGLAKCVEDAYAAGQKDYGAVQICMTGAFPAAVSAFDDLHECSVEIGKEECFWHWSTCIEQPDLPTECWKPLMDCYTFSPGLTLEVELPAVCPAAQSCFELTVDGSYCSSSVKPYWCFPDDTCVVEGDASAEEPCMTCQAASSQVDWTAAKPGTICGYGKTCAPAGSCTAVFDDSALVQIPGGEADWGADCTDELGTLWSEGYVPPFVAAVLTASSAAALDGTPVPASAVEGAKEEPLMATLPECLEYLAAYVKTLGEEPCILIGTDGEWTSAPVADCHSVRLASPAEAAAMRPTGAFPAVPAWALGRDVADEGGPMVWWDPSLGASMAWTTHLSPTADAAWCGVQEAIAVAKVGACVFVRTAE